jgi:acyl transferase domain-containing protein
MADGSLDAGVNDIAVIGLSLRVPGATDAIQFWNNLRLGVESIETRSVDQLTAAGEQLARIRRRNYVPRTAELPGMANFDAEFFGFSPKDAAIMDPQHRQFLECAWEAMEDATRPPERTPGPVGVFAGCGMGSYFYFNVCSHRPLVDQVGMFLLRHTGNDKDFLATRASYLFDLHGPSVNVQTACSTSLVAIHYACQSLLNGECEMALAGGVTIELPHGHGYLHQEGEILAPDGHCRAFDHRAAGTVFGSGAGVVVLRRLADALADGDPIRAVIKATAINNDGAGKASYLAPSVTGQAEAIVEAHGLAGVGADSIQYVECHGTGTNLGDPIEIAALTQAFRQSTDKTGFCRVGSVKSNIGHLDTAAGVVSLIKAVLALEHAEIPPTLGYEKPNPAIDFATSPFVVNDRLTPWPKTAGPRRAGVNSLGVGGTNAHAVLEEAPRSAARPVSVDAGPVILAMSARSRKALDDASRRLAEHLQAHPDLALADVAKTLVEGRKRFEHRRVVAVADREDAIAVLSKPEIRRAASHTAIDGVSGAVLMFPGGGAQYPGMGLALYRHESSFAKTVDEGLSYLPSELASRLRDLWLGQSTPKPEAAEHLLQPSLQLPAILIIEVALARLWQSWGLKPAALIGHSMGEYAAASIAGVMSFERAVKLVQLRGQLFDEISGGGMLSVQMGADAMRARLPAALDIGVINAPELCVVSGPNADIECFRQVLVAEGIEAVRVPINIAAHSRLLEPILARFEGFLRATPLTVPSIPIVSNLTGTWLKPEEATDPLYWVKHLRSTVRFAEGMTTLAADPSRVYIEAGPGRTLSSLAKAQGPITANAVINTLPHADEDLDDRLHFLTSVGRVWATGLELPIERLWSGAKAKRVRLPAYPFQHQRYFLDRVVSAHNEQANELPVKRPDMATWGWRPAWKPAYADRSPGGEQAPGAFLVFLDDGRTGTEIVDRLRAAGHRVCTVALGDSFTVQTNECFTLCPEHGRDGYDQLVRHLANHGGMPGHIVHLWLLTSEERFRPGSSFFHRNQERGFYSLFFLGQALGDVDQAAPVQITVLTNGMQRVGAEPLPYPEKATILGPAQVMPREMPGVFVRVVDVDQSPSISKLAQRAAQAADRSSKAVVDWLRKSARASASAPAIDLVWDELFAVSGNEIVAHRGVRRWVRHYQEVPLREVPAGASRFRENGVYLITGGLGDLAISCAIDLAKRYRARIGLLGRIDLPERSEWPRYLATYGSSGRIGQAIASIKQIEDAGGQAHYLRGDVTNTEAMRRAKIDLKSRFGALHGVLHAAGVIKDELIALKATGDIEDVLAPKVLGTLVLQEVLAGEPIELLVLFSSTSTDTAPAGQIDYVAANAYLNAFAESRAGQAGPYTVAVHWGVWSNAGLAARAIEQAERHETVPSVETTSQPLFDQRVSVDVHGEWLELRCDPARQWLLDEHRLRSGEPVWPGTGYLEMVAEAAREFGIWGAIDIQDLTFVRPLHVPDGQTRAVRVRVERDAQRLKLTVESGTGLVNAPAAWTRHAEATASALRRPGPPPLDIAGLLASCGKSVCASDGQTLRSAQADHLRFGLRWQVLREVHMGDATAMAKLRLAPEFSVDLERGLVLHPALMDIATGYAMALIDGYDPAQGLWVPVTYGRIVLHQPLPASIWSHAKLNTQNDLGPGFATFDVTIMDEQGVVLVEVESFTVKHLGHQPSGDAAFSLSLQKNSPVEQAAAIRDNAPRELSPALQRLAAQVEQGIGREEGFEALVRAVETGLPQVVVSSMDLAFLQRSVVGAEATVSSATASERPDIESAFVAPRTDVEKTLAGFWSELLGIDKIGVDDSFFDLGGHSLVAVRLFRMIKKTYAIDLPMSVLFEAPTIAQCAKVIEQAGGRSSKADASSKSGPEPTAAPAPERATHLVQMHAGKQTHATPLFICAGMFGNILNLRHLAIQIGQDRPVYGLQARGLYGQQAPHETFEDTARDYLAEVRSVQPHGPYLLSGFSGGGLVAFEMAQQLVAAGETVAMLVMLDTPHTEVIELSVADRVSIKIDELRKEKAAFIGQWIRRRMAWKREQYGNAIGDAQPSAERFHNATIEAAFRRALGRYRAKPYDGRVLLLRPKLSTVYRLRDGRQLNSERRLLNADNGWTPYIGKLSIIEVPGDHDSMVLEPNVRVLASHLRETLKSAWRPMPATRIAAE